MGFDASTREPNSCRIHSNLLVYETINVSKMTIYQHVVWLNLLHNQGSTLSQSRGETWHGLDTHFDCFHWAQCNVSEELGWSRGSQIQSGPVHKCILFSDKVSVEDFEGLIETKLADTLSSIKKIVIIWYLIINANCTISVTKISCIPVLSNRWQLVPIPCPIL